MTFQTTRETTTGIVIPTSEANPQRWCSLTRWWQRMRRYLSRHLFAFSQLAYSLALRRWLGGMTIVHDPEHADENI